MKFTNPLIRAKFLKRYKRFFADAELNGEVIVAHVPNTGSLKSVIQPGAQCLLSPAANPERKLKFTLEAIASSEGHWVGVNTSWPNTLVGEAFDEKKFSHWQAFDHRRSEVKISSESRIDWVFQNSQTGHQHFVEVKNVTLATGPIEESKGVAQFPDAVTERGQKHLRELIRLSQQKNQTAEIFFAIQRPDCVSFTPADSIDPEYGRLLREAAEAGVRVTAAEIFIDEKEIYYTGKTVPVDLGISKESNSSDSNSQQSHFPQPKFLQS